MRNANIPTLVTREPGGTPLGESVRAIFIDANVELSGITETLLLNASRAELCHKVIRPALREGKLVVCDRFWDATLAYQGYGRGLPLDALRQVNDFAAGGLTPDRTFLLDIAPSVSAERLATRAADRMEREDIEFHQRVADGYRRLAAAAPERFVVIDGTLPQAEVALRVRDAVMACWHA